VTATMAQQHIADTGLKNIQEILQGHAQHFERLADTLVSRNAVIPVIAERIASIDEHVQGKANLLWRIEASLVVQRQRLNALEKSIAAAVSSPESSGGPA